MVKTKNLLGKHTGAEYEHPQMELVLFSTTDIIVTSGGGDENEGEWDPQSLNRVI